MLPEIASKFWRWSLAALLVLVVMLGWRWSIDRPPVILQAQLQISRRNRSPLRFTDRDGKTVALQDFLGKVVVVLDIWATWCAPCRAEFPRLDHLQQALAAQGLEVVPLSVDLGGRTPVDRFYQEVKVSALGAYFDPSGDSAKALGLRGLPTTLILDRQGLEIGRVAIFHQNYQFRLGNDMRKET